MGMTRRGFLAGGAAAVAAASATGCLRAPKAGGKGGAFTIYWNAGHVYPAYQKIFDTFAEEHDLEVNLQRFQWPDLITKLQADIASGNVPDLVEMAGGVPVIPLAISGDVLPIDGYVSKSGDKVRYPDDWQPTSVRPWKHDDRTYGVQIHLTCNQIYYNERTLADAGVDVPTTWEEMLDTAKELTGGGRYGLALNQDYTYSYPWLIQNGVRAYDPATNEVLVPHDATVEALQFQQDLAHRHKVSPVPTPSSDAAGPQRLLSAKRAAMILSGPWDILPIRKGSPDLDLGLALPLSKVRRGSHLAGAGVMIPKRAQNPELAWELVTRLTTLPTELKVTEQAAMAMPRKSWRRDPAVESDATMNAVAAGLKYGIDWWQHLAPTGKVPKIEAAYKVLYQSVVLSGKPPEQQLRKFLDVARKELRS